MANRPKYIVYHTAAANGDHDIEEVRLWHTLPKAPEGTKPIPGIHGNGWNDIGYHWYIRRSGELQKGRDESISGAHCYGYNTRSIGICFEGHGDYEQWTYRQLLVFLRLVKDIFYRYPLIEIKFILGHRETGSPKTCPGTLIDCEKVRNLVRLYLHLN